jgi:hypothetical protein
LALFFTRLAAAAHKNGLFLNQTPAVIVIMQTKTLLFQFTGYVYS